MTALARAAGVLCLLAMLPTSPAWAQVRRAVIVGINQYAVDPRTDRTSDLDGAVNDAEAIAETLRTYHQFLPADIHLLLDRQATRAHILKELQEHLIDRAQPGDISLFFFAGHGSYQDNAASRELDRRDETIVPADTNRGVPDIIDKELARLFNRVLDRNAQLVGIFDSCHSGSIARGLGSEAKVRFAPPRSATAIPGSTASAQPDTVLPEDRGALILAAAQDQQPAQERYIKGQARGRFSSALQQVLNSAATDESVENLFLRLRALMQAGGSNQEPVLATTKQRRHLAMWGSAVAVRGVALPPRVAIGRVTAEVVYLQAGFAIGLGPQAKLENPEANPPTQLKVTEVLGPTTSKATVVGGNLGSVKPGELFIIREYGVPFLEPLQLYLTSAPPARHDVEATVKALLPLRAATGVVWVDDPTVTTPTHTLQWLQGQWVLSAPQQQKVPLGVRPTSKQVLRELHKDMHAPVRLFLNLPLPAESLRALALGQTGPNQSIELTPLVARADYMLVGRVAEQRLEFAWLRPDVDQASQPSGPVHTDWEPLDDHGFADTLTEYALQLARLKTWQSLDSPPGLQRFPYRLQLQDLQTKKYLAVGTTVHNGETYRPVLVADEEPKNVQPRYVYLFALDSHGASTLLVPGPEMAAGENLLPDGRDRGPAPLTIALGHGFAVSPPFGTDTLILLTSATALPDPSVLNYRPLTRGVATRGVCTHPLECLIFGINQEGTRGVLRAPPDWSIERRIVQSAP